LGGDFDLTGDRIKNLSIIVGSVAPTAPPPEDLKPWIFVDESVRQITHYWGGTKWIPFFAPSSIVNPTYGTITDTVATGDTNAVANWGYLEDGTPIATDRVYFADTAGNINKTVTFANLKPLLVDPVRFSPTYSGAASGLIPKSAQVFRLGDGDFFDPLTLPAIDQYSEPLTIISRATNPSSISTTNQVPGATVVPIVTNVARTFYPTGDGWLVAPLAAIAPDQVVNVTGATLPIAFPVATIPGTPVFTPATPTSSTAIYAITDGTAIVYAKWNGTQYIGAPAPAASPGHFRSGAGTTGPDGVADPTENVSRIGKTGFGIVDPTAIQATIDNFGTFTTRGTTVANSLGFYIMSGLVPNTQAAIMITQTAVDCALSVGSPVGQTAFGRYFRVHNDPTSTNNLTFQNNVIKPGRYIDLQWNGTAWASEALYQPDGFPRSGSQSIGGIIPAGATSYTDSNGSENATVTLPTAVGRKNEIFTVNHTATADATLLGTNKIPAASLLLTAANRVTQYISDGTNWVSIPGAVPADFWNSAGSLLPDGTADLTEAIARTGKTSFGTASAATNRATVDIYGTLADRGIIANNNLAAYAVGFTDIVSSIRITQTVNDAVLTIPLPSPVIAGQHYRVFNASASTKNLIYLGVTITPGTFLDLQQEGSGWAKEARDSGGNITSVLSNVAPAAVLNVGGLFEVSMPASTDVQIRALVARQVYISSEGEYPGGSFTTSTAAIVNLTTTFVPADNNVHVAGEMNIVRIQDILTGRIFRVTVWRLGAVTGNWSGWCEEIGATTNQILTALAPIELTSGVVTFAAPYIRGQGVINIGDFNTATVSPSTTAGITASIISGSGSSPMVMSVALPAGMVPDDLYKVLPVITSNIAEAAGANATVVCQIAGGKTAVSFRVIFRETLGVTQNCNFEFVIIR
jgi:hypothetical protein